MKVEWVEAKNVAPKVPFVLGGVYRYKQYDHYYILNRCQKSGFQLNGTSGMVLVEGPMDNENDMERYLNDGSWTYIPNAKLVIEE